MYWGEYMESLVVIGCRSCLKEVLIDEESFITEKSSPFTVDTAYSFEDINQLFLNNYTCPFCQNMLIFTPKMMSFFSIFMDKKYHIRFTENIIQIINENETAKISKRLDSQSLNSISEYFIARSVEKKFPTVEEMKDILFVAKEIDSTKWNVTIESGVINEPIPNLTPKDFL